MSVSKIHCHQINTGPCLITELLYSELNYATNRSLTWPDLLPITAELVWTYHFHVFDTVP